VDKEQRERVERATVWLPDRLGQGVLVPGGFILTAVHCLNSCDIINTVSEGPLPHRVETYDGRSLTLDVHAAEVRADIAVLGGMDTQTFHHEAEAFDEFCDSTLPVPLFGEDMEWDVPYTIHICTHKKTWITGEATRDASFGDCFIITSGAEHVEEGTSGGPIVNDSGLLMGVVSSTFGADGTAIASRLHRALPLRILDQILGKRDTVDNPQLLAQLREAMQGVEIKHASD